MLVRIDFNSVFSLVNHLIDHLALIVKKSKQEHDQNRSLDESYCVWYFIIITATGSKNDKDRNIKHIQIGGERTPMGPGRNPAHHMPVVVVSFVPRVKSRRTVIRN